MTLSKMMSFGKVDDVESHLQDLIHQKNILESIEKYSDKLDFGDLIETYSILNDEIEKLQRRVRDEIDRLQSGSSGERGKEEGEAKTSSSNFFVEQLVEGYDKKLRPVMREDVDVEKNKGIMEAFNMIYEWNRKEHSRKGVDDSESSYNRFKLKDQESLLKLMKERDSR